MFRPHHAFAAFTSTALAMVLAAGCSDPEPATPRVTFDSNIAPGPNPSTACTESGTWFTIGDFGAPPQTPVRPIEDGQPDQQGQVTVTCSVTPTGDGFNVRATAALSGATGGTFLIEGLFREQGEQTGIRTTISKAGRSGAYRSDECIVRYTTEFQGVAAGRVWGELDCPQATPTSASTEDITCQVKAQFRFENCIQ
jgi:hypothetical protein